MPDAVKYSVGIEKQLGKQLFFPTTLMIGSDGCVLASIVGAAPQACEPVIQKLLAEERNAAKNTPCTSSGTRRICRRPPLFFRFYPPLSLFRIQKSGCS